MFAGVAVLVAVAYVVAAIVRGVPEAGIVSGPLSGAFPGSPHALAWPGQGEAAVGVEGVGLMGAHGSRRPTPIASVAKVMTAYLVLRDHPLQSGAGGPQITVTPADVAVYRADVAAGQSAVAVRADERLTERQALEGLLLPSGNNIATLLARWDAGSEAAFVAKMNALARALDLTRTRYSDASGVSAGTVSTAGDQVRLAMLALEVPTFRQIVAMAQVTLPVAGRQYNVDGLLGRDGIVGVKTGYTSRAGGCFVFAAHELISGRSVTVVGAVLHQPATRGQPSIIEAVFQASATLLASTRHRTLKLRVVRRGATLAWVITPWAGRVAAPATRSVSLIGWPGLPIRESIVTAPNLATPLRAGQDLGTAILAAGQQRARVRFSASRAVPQASLAWRLTHP